MIDFSKRNSFTEPYSFFTLDNVFDDDILKKLLDEFPDVSNTKSVMGGRRKLDSVDANHWLSSSPTWKKFYNFINRQENLDFIQSNYKQELDYWKSSINEKTSITDDCYVHIDWSMAEDGYVREIHCDSDPRFWNFLIFLNDKHWSGGDFTMHSSDEINYFKKHFWKRKLPIAKVFEAKKNFGVFFLSTPNSYHSVSLQLETKEPRKFIYGSISFKGKTFHRLHRENPNYLNMVGDYADELPQVFKKIKSKLFGR